MLKLLDKTPLFDFNMRLGEGTGAALGISMVEAGVKLLNEMATFQEVMVSEPVQNAMYGKASPAIYF